VEVSGRGQTPLQRRQDIRTRICEDTARYVPKGTSLYRASMIRLEHFLSESSIQPPRRRPLPASRLLLSSQCGNLIPFCVLHLCSMSVWDAFSGRKSSRQSAEPTSHAQSTPSSPSAPQAYTPTHFDAPDASSFLGSASLPDASQLHPLAGLNQQTLDYLTLDESTLSDLPGSRSILPSRGWSDDLCYGTGTVYLTALMTGGTWGLIEGLNRTPASAPPKLRLNSVLNSVTRRGPFLGNSAGVVAMVYNGVNSTIGYYRGKHDIANSIAAGAFSGAIFKSTRGVKPMLISSAIVASVAGAWAVSSHSLFDLVHMLICVQITRKVIFEPGEPTEIKQTETVIAPGGATL
jgi:mitochondrial import inner membrane translocase subunit TIM23